MGQQVLHCKGNQDGNAQCNQDRETTGVAIAFEERQELKQRKRKRNRRRGREGSRGLLV